MDKETLSNYGWIVICVLVLAVMIALAGPFGTFVAGAVKSTTAGLFGVNQNALGAAGIEIGDQAFANCEHLATEIRNATADYSGDTCCKECGIVLGTGTYTIPTGGKYTKADGTVLNAGQPFPEELTMGDKYEYGDYQYRYNQYYGYNSTWHDDETQNGWGVRCINNVAEPGVVLEKINNVPITNMRYAFYGCTYITTSPAIPSNVTSLEMAYGLCRNLTVVPNLSNCNKLTNIENIFYECTSLVDLSDFIIPESVTNMSWAFTKCTSLVAAPVVPSGVTDIMCAFYECYSLTGTITINTNHITNKTYNAEYGCYSCFSGVDMTNITLTGSASKEVLNLIGSTGNNWTPIS